MSDVDIYASAKGAGIGAASGASLTCLIGLVDTLTERFNMYAVTSDSHLTYAALFILLTGAGTLIGDKLAGGGVELDHEL